MPTVPNYEESIENLWTKKTHQTEKKGNGMDQTETAQLIRSPRQKQRRLCQSTDLASTEQLFRTYKYMWRQLTELILSRPNVSHTNNRIII